MNVSFEPSPDFVEKVMRRVREHEASRAGLFHGLMRLVAASGALLGVLRAAPVF